MKERKRLEGKGKKKGVYVKEIGSVCKWEYKEEAERVKGVDKRKEEKIRMVIRKDFNVRTGYNGKLVCRMSGERGSGNRRKKEIKEQIKT